MPEHTEQSAAEALARVRRVLDDELANLADDGARLSHSVVRRVEAALAARPVTAQQSAVEAHICDTGHFDRTVCPEPCGAMHSYCSTCGARADHCAHEASAQEGAVEALADAATRVSAWLDDDEVLRIPDTEWGRCLYDDLRALTDVDRLAEHTRKAVDDALAGVERAVGMYGFRFSSREDHGEALAIVREARARGGDNRA